MIEQYRNKLTALARYTFAEAVRSRLPWLLLAILLLSLGLVQFLAGVAITETREIQVAILSGMLRMAAVFIVALFVVTSMVRELNDKVTELLLSMAIPRAVYLLGRLAGFALVALFAAMLFCMPLLLLAQPAAVLIWGISLAGELLIIAAASLLCVLSFRQVTTSLTVVAAFYLFARSIGAIQLLTQGSLVDPNSLYSQAAGGIIHGIAYLTPDLYRFTSSEWLVYGNDGWQVLLPVLAQTLIYVALLCGAALFDLYRKEF